MEAILRDMGLERAENEHGADVIILNSCSVRQSAEDRIYGLCRNYAKLKKNNPNLIVAVTGCMIGRDRGGVIKKKLKHADLIFETRRMNELPRMLSELNQTFRRLDQPLDYLSIKPRYASRFQAFVTIQTGCNHFCTYCVVPFARGYEGNRPLAQIMAEINDLAASGCLEITLLGQIINHYKAPDPEIFSNNNPYKKNNFAGLLWEINQIQGIERVHWTAPHPLYVDEEVLDALCLPKQVNYLHLPIQSGSSRILKKMNRRHDRNYFIKIIDAIREKKPDMAIGTDIIVGFCSETAADFADTVELYKRCDFDIAYIARYSVRSNTVAAAAFDDDVSGKEKKLRFRRLQDLMEKTVYKKNQKYVGATLSVLVESYRDGYCSGHSSEMKLVRFPGSSVLVGTIRPVKIFKAQEWLLYGELKRKKH